jgi:hypothetical protein
MSGFNMHYRYLVVLGALFLASCQKAPSGPPLVPVSGKVQLDGKPLANAIVTFTPTGATLGIGSDAVTNEAGEYKLKSRRTGDGAVVGTYKVTISKLLMPDGSEPVFDEKNPPASSPAKESLPLKYSNQARTTLTATVAEGGTTLDFSLQSRK